MRGLADGVKNGGMSKIRVLLVLGVVTVAVAVVLASAGGLMETTQRSPLGFDEVSNETGFQYRVVQSEEVASGGGVYVTDFNNDGWPDVLAIGGTADRHEWGWGSGGPALFENTGGQFNRSRALPQDELTGKFQGAHVFDYDNDNRDDILLLREAEKPIFLENEGGTFRVVDVGFERVLTEPVGATSADYDGDGCLDLYIIQNGDWSDNTPKGFDAPNASIEDDNGNQNLLYDGNCDSFEPVNGTATAGTRWSLATSFVDLTGDGRPDIHVANDYNHDYVYINQGNGQFRAVQLGPATNRNGMSSEVFDVNRDQEPDIFVTNIYIDVANISDPYLKNFLNYRLGKRADGGNTMLVNRGSGEFSDEADAYNLSEGGWGWAASATDFDNDGSVEVFHTTQRITSGSEQFSNGTDAQYLQYPLLYDRRGETFYKRNSSKLGFVPTDGLGAARLDFDRDGDQDIVVGTVGTGRFRLYENTVDGRNWLQVRAYDTDGIASSAAQVTVISNNRTRTRFGTSGSGMVSQDSRVHQFGLGNDTTADVVVRWPDGTEIRLDDINSNQRIRVYPNGTATEAPSPEVGTEGR